MAFDELRDNLANSKTFEERDQSEVDLHGGSEDDGFGGGGDGIFDLVGPDIFDRLSNQRDSTIIRREYQP